MKIGFVGLGNMGGVMAGRLLSAGHEVFGTNRTKARAGDLIGRGLIWRDTPREVAQAADLTISMVADDDALEAIASGQDGVLAGLASGKTYVDMSTVSPTVSRGLAEQVRSLGSDMLEAPVSGSVPAAESGSLTIMVGGDEAIFHRAEPVLRVLGSTVTYVGGNGKALLLKLAINVSLGAQMLAFSESVLLAERGGLDRKLSVDVMAHSAIGSPMLQARGPFVLNLPERAWFDVELMQKDIRLALRAGADFGIPMPTAEAVDRLLTKARELGYAHRDIAAMFEVLARS
jgi:3-hydroxyisobutyrate dehydrogenase-like beta-hydroxyacid dehydrogenase